MQEFKDILIIKLSAIGDVVHSIPFLEVMHRRFPHARIDWMVEENAYGVVKGHPALNRVIVSPRQAIAKKIKNPKEWLWISKEAIQFLQELRLYQYDLVIDLQGLLKSGVLLGLSRGRKKMGMQGAREGAWYFTNEPAIPVHYNQHAIDRYIEVARYLGCHILEWSGKIPFGACEQKGLGRILSGKDISPNSPMVAINPVARWQTKLWYPEKFAHVADKIHEDIGCDIIFTGSRSDRPVIDFILQHMNTRAFNLAGETSLKELAILYSCCMAVVSTDTGPMHIAAAMGTRVVAIFGPTDPRMTGPYGDGHRVLWAERLACTPCFKKLCDKKTCMKSISVDAVVNAVRDIVETS